MMATEEEPPAPAPAAEEEEEAAPAPPPAAAIDPCDPKRLMFDSIDLLAYEIITNPSKRAERKGQLEYFLDRVGELPVYGRAGSRLSLAVLLENFCCRDAYQLKDPPSGDANKKQSKEAVETEAEINTEDAKPVPLVVMPPDEWQTYAQMLENVYGDMRRMDANAPILPEALAEQKPFGAADPNKTNATNNDDAEDGPTKTKDPRIVAHNRTLIDAAPNPALEDHKEFTRKYREIEISLQFHRAMAGTMREVLEKLMAAPGGDMAESEDSDSEEEEEEEEDEVPEVSQEVLVEFHNFINDTFTEEWGIGAKELLLKLINVDAGEDGSAARIRLRKPSKLRRVYSRKEFDLVRFQSKMERLMTKWNEVVLDVPRMVAMSYSQTVFPPTASDAERPVAPERPMPVMEKRVRQKKASAAAADDGDDDVAAPMPDDEEYEADKEQQPTSKKSKKDKRKRRDRGEGDEAAEFGPTGTQVKKKRRRGKRDRVSLDRMDRKGGSKENQPEVEDGPEVKELARARDNLREEVVDPLDDMRALAATAQARPAGSRAAVKKKAQAVAQKRNAELDGQTPNIYKKKKSSKQLQWTSDEESDSDDGDDDAEIKAGTTLSEVPNRPKIKKTTPPSQQKKAKPATQLLVHRERNSGGGLKRKRFTEEEKGAIKLGVQRFGFGRWAQIKEYYAEELRDRTSVNIKDCYRTMQGKGEV